MNDTTSDIIIENDSQSFTMIRLDQTVEYNGLKLQIKKVEFGSWKGIATSDYLPAPIFNGWKTILEMINETPENLKMSLRTQLVYTDNSKAEMNRDSGIIAIHYLNRYGNLYVNNSWDEELSAIVRTWTQGKSKIVFQLIHTKSGDILKFYDDNQNITAIIDPKYNIEIMPNKSIRIPVFHIGASINST